MIKLKPCPFCGSENLTLVKPITGFTKAYVRCNICRAFGPDSDSAGQAARSWNKKKEKEGYWIEDHWQLPITHICSHCEYSITDLDAEYCPRCGYHNTEMKFKNV